MIFGRLKGFLLCQCIAQAAVATNACPVADCAEPHCLSRPPSWADTLNGAGQYMASVKQVWPLRKCCSVYTYGSRRLHIWNVSTGMRVVEDQFAPVAAATYLHTVCLVCGAARVSILILSPVAQLSQGWFRTLCSFQCFLELGGCENGKQPRKVFLIRSENV